MKKFFAMPGVANSWWLVVSRGDGSVPVCTVSLGLIPPLLHGEGGIEEIRRRASEIFPSHLGEDESLLVFMFNRSTGRYIPQAGCTTSNPSVEAKLLVGFPWINTSEELPCTEDFLLSLDIEPHVINRRLAGMAARRAHAEPIPVPTFGHGSGT